MSLIFIKIEVTKKGTLTSNDLINQSTHTQTSSRTFKDPTLKLHLFIQPSPPPPHHHLKNTQKNLMILIFLFITKQYAYVVEMCRGGRGFGKFMEFDFIEPEK